MRPVVLTPEQREELRRLRDTAPKAYLRERAAALLKVADGLPAAQVARTGLLRRRKPATLYDWLTRFEREGVAGLTLRKGRGRKPAFSP
jgi:transposase